MPEEFYVRMWHTIKIDKKPFVDEIHNKTKEGANIIQELRISPILDKAGEVKLFLGLELNVTERERKQKNKEELASAIAHQFKTPLTAIRWLLDLLLEDKSFTSQQRRQLKEIYTHNLNQMALVDCLLMINRINSTDWARAESIDIFTEVKNIVELAREQFPHLQIHFEAAEEKMPLLANKILSVQVFANIITNAAEYSPKTQGSVRVVLKSDRDYYYFSCRDNGVGIPKVEQKNIFSKFFRASNALVAKKGGTGLGLYIVKMITDSFGWSIDFKSRANNGTTFLVKIPKNSYNGH